jgi:hypothetical protein
VWLFRIGGIQRRTRGKRFELINLKLYIGVRRMRGGRKVDDKKLGIMWLDTPHAHPPVKNM